MCFKGSWTHTGNYLLHSVVNTNSLARLSRVAQRLGLSTRPHPPPPTCLFQTYFSTALSTLRKFHPQKFEKIQTIRKWRKKRLADMTWIKDSILTDDQLVKENAKLEFLEISPKHKDELHAKHKTSFEKDQAKYDKLFEYEAQKVVKSAPRIPKALRPPPSSGTPPGPPSSQPTSVDMGSTFLTGFV